MEPQTKKSTVSKFLEEHSLLTIAIYGIFIILVIVFIYFMNNNSLDHSYVIYGSIFLAAMGALLFFLRNKSKKTERERMFATNKHD